jgi:hypothetical protein
MRQFQDHEGGEWVAEIGKREGLDYKGQYFMVMRSGEGGEEVELQDVRWNSERTARRTLKTMSDVELRRRLRSARGRASSAVEGGGSPAS